uniref:Uncharacterized protein n=1 Tax=Octopus bimaculoides TaxID=37653 RepID=A0A0L8FMM3_OCTBM
MFRVFSMSIPSNPHKECFHPFLLFIEYKKKFLKKCNGISNCYKKKIKRSRERERETFKELLYHFRYQKILKDKVKPKGKKIEIIKRTMQL